MKAAGQAGCSSIRRSFLTTVTAVGLTAVQLLEQQQRLGSIRQSSPSIVQKRNHGRFFPGANKKICLTAVEDSAGWRTRLACFLFVGFGPAGW